MADRPSISLRYARRVIETAKQGRIPEAELLAAAPLTPFDHFGDPRVTGEQYYALWAAAMERANDPAFPLRVARATGIETYEVFGFVCMTSGSFREGLHAAARYLRIWTDLASWQLTEEPRTARLELVPGSVRHPASRFAAELALAEVLHTSRQYLGVHWSPAEVHFPWRKPPRTEHLTGFFEGALKFERPAAALVFDPKLLELKPLKADPAMAGFFVGHAEQLLARAPNEPDVVAQARRFIASALSRGTPTVDQAAKHLATSARTLRRRLAEQGFTFARLLDTTRCALARQHLEEQRLSLAEIAFVLGFSEVSTFHRSFRRWTGLTPGAYRAGERR